MTQSRTSSSIIVWSAKAFLTLVLLLGASTMPAYAQEFVMPHPEPAKDFTVNATPQVTTNSGGFLGGWGIWILLGILAIVALLMFLGRKKSTTNDDHDDHRHEHAHGAPAHEPHAPEAPAAPEPHGPRPAAPATGGGHTGHAVLPFILAAAGTLGFATMASAQSITNVHPTTMVKGGGLQGYTLTVNGACEPTRILTNQAPDVIIVMANSVKRVNGVVKFDARATSAATESITEVQVLCKDGSKLTTGNKAMLAVVPASVNYVGHQTTQRLTTELASRDAKIAELQKAVDALKASDRTTATAIARLTQASSTHATTAYVDSQATTLRGAMTSTQAALLARIEAAEQQVKEASTAANTANGIIRDEVRPRLDAADQRTTALVTTIGAVANAQVTTLERLTELKKRGFLGLRESTQFKEGTPERVEIEDALKQMQAIALAAAGKREGGQ